MCLLTTEFSFIVSVGSSNHLVEEDSAVRPIRRDACVCLMIGCAEFLKLLYAVFGCLKILIKEKKC